MALHCRRKAPLPDIVCYHCQQCVEKYRKAHLIAHGSTPPRIHDLEDLFNLCALYDATLTARLPLVHVLNPYGVLIRYPGMTATVAEAQAAVTPRASCASSCGAHWDCESEKGVSMTFDELLDQVCDLLKRQERVSYQALKIRFQLAIPYPGPSPAGEVVGAAVGDEPESPVVAAWQAR